jgi:uncharacterized membrane protein YdfJ with MMPL/SSD domain
MEAIDLAKAIRKELGIAGGDPGQAAAGRVAVHLGGQGAVWAAFQEASKDDVAVAEVRAFPVIAIVLLAVFGSLAAAALPLALGIAAVTIAGAVIYALSSQMEMWIFVTNVASMIGIGVAVDYSLFVVARYREEIRRGRPPEDARATAMATSGVAVLFSGVTVIASMAGLFLTSSAAMASMAIGAIVVVAVTMAATATLLPALIARAGSRINEPGRLFRAFERRREGRSERRRRRQFWERWTRAVMRRPVRAVVAAAAVLLALSYPALDLEMANFPLTQLEPEHELRQGARAASSVVGPGGLGPLRIQVAFTSGDAHAPANGEALRRSVSALRRDHGVERVDRPRIATDGESALLTAIPRASPGSQAAIDLVERLRRGLPAAVGPRAEVRVGGATAVSHDFDRLIAGSMWKIALFVLALSFVVLLILLRSIVLSAKAVLMNVLSVAAAYGVMVAVFQWGWGSLLGLEETRAIDTVTPPLVLVIAFGLSMDYEVFLLSRIRERYAATGDNRRAVAEGLASSARTITSAALIMVVVFLAFVSSGLPGIQRIGIAIAAAIALDATIVRLVLVPAAMELLGKWNWWMPRWLDRVLPATDRGLRHKPVPRTASVDASG